MSLPQNPFKQFESLELNSLNNLFLIDWLTFTTFVDDVQSVKRLLGLDDPSIPWSDEVKFRNGYPQQCYWSGITISYGADNAEYYKDPSKARTDMGICVNLSGKGCRCFESYGHGDWMRLFAAFFSGAKYNVTRLDLAFDDHVGILDIHQIAADTRDRYYVSRSKYAEIVWSDNETTNIQGLTVQVGAAASRTLIRIYDKAAERGFADRHWIRVELQLRHENAAVACAQLFQERHVGKVTTGILRNYLTYRVPSADTNKSRWVIAPYWDRLVMDMEKISLWLSPGDEYNFSKTERWLIDQCGQAIIAAMRMHRLPFLIKQAEQQNQVLAPKYERAIAQYAMACKRDRNWTVLSSDDIDDLPAEWLQEQLPDV